MREHQRTELIVKFSPEKGPTKYHAARGNLATTPWPPPSLCSGKIESSRHQENYDELMKSFKKRDIVSPKQLDYIFGLGSYSQGRVPDQGADACKRDLESIGVTLDLLQHYGLSKEATVPHSESSGRQKPESAKVKGDGPDSSKVAGDGPDSSKIAGDGPDSSKIASDGKRNNEQVVYGMELMEKHGKTGDWGNWDDVSNSIMYARSLY